MLLIITKINLNTYSIAEPLRRFGSRAFCKPNNLNQMKIINYNIENNLDIIDEKVFAFDQE